MASLAVASSVVVSMVAPSASSGSVSFSSSTSLRMASSVTAVAPLRARVVKMSAVPNKASTDIADITEMIDQRVHEAEDAGCKADDTVECVARWEEIEELSAARAHKKAQAQDQATNDPLNKFCNDNPEADECRTYED